MTRALQINRQWIYRAFKHAFFVLLLVLAILYVQSQWSQIDPELIARNWPLLLISLGLFMVGHFLLPLGSWLILRWAQHPLNLLAVWRTFYLSQIAKYLPGSIWSLPGRAFLYQQSKIPALQSGAFVLMEVFYMCCGALIVGLLSLPLILPLLNSPTVIASVLAVGVLGLVLLLVLLKQIKSRWGRLWQIMSHFSLTRTMILIAVYALNWLLLGAAFALLCFTFIPDLGWGGALQMIGLHSLGWLIGFLVIFTPGGIGVRDAILAFGVVGYVAAPLPIMISLLARIAWTIAEIVGILIVTAVYGLRSK